MINWIERKTNGTVVIVVLVLALAVYWLMLAVTIPEVRAGSGGVEVFDLRTLGYSIQDAHLILSSLSEEARNYYRNVQIPVDFLYPLLMGLFGAFALAWIRRTVAIPRWSIAVPLAAAACDYLENIGVLLMLNGNASDVLITLSSFCTIGKGILTTVFLTALPVLFAILLAKKRTSVKSQIHGS